MSQPYQITMGCVLYWLLIVLDFFPAPPCPGHECKVYQMKNSNFKIYARPDLATNLLQILIPATINSLVCQKGNMHFSYVLDDGLLGKYMVIAPQKSKLKNLLRNFCLSKQTFFRKLPVQKTGRTGPG